MKVLIIYDSEIKTQVEALRNGIASKFGHSTVLRMNPHNKADVRKVRIKHLWHMEAKRMLRLADVVVYAVSSHSHENKNVEWEINYALKHGKYIVCLPLEEDAMLNDSLFTTDKNTKEKVCLADVIKTEEELHKIIRDYNTDAYIRLFNEDKDPSLLLEQYKIFSDSAEALVTRRQNMNSFYISANTALVTIGATVFALCDEKDLISKLVIVMVLSVPGIMINISWRKTLQSYFINNRGKMKVLSMLEKRLPASLYDAEWKAMKNKFSSEKYVSFTDSEKKLPLIFVWLYIVADIAALIALFIHLF